MEMTKTDGEVIGGFMLAAVCIAFLALIVALVGQKDVTVEMSGGIEAHDLRMAVISCTPTRATFEQELACYKAIWGGRDQ